VAFVGGSLVEKGGHNPLEPAALGVPVVMGPHIFNFQEICQLLTDAGGMVVCQNQEEAISTICNLFAHEERVKEMGEKGRTAVLQNQGALERTLRVVEEVF